MKALVVSYSLTGNNSMLAGHLARLIGADLEELTVNRKMTNGALALDAMFNRRPPLAPGPHDPGAYDAVILVGPVWMGKIASPLRSYGRDLRGGESPARRPLVAFIALCGGALGKNPKVESQVQRLIGRAPVAVKQLYINDLLPEEQRNDSKATSAYQVTPADFDGMWAAEIRELIGAVQGAAVNSAEI